MAGEGAVRGADEPQFSVPGFLSFIRFSHTIFAMPFALGALVAASGGLPAWKTLLLVVLAMIFARTAAMTFNRVADWEIDKANPRTAMRHRLISKASATVACIVASSLFVICTAFLNRLCLILSPVALVLILGYSLTKRFTHLAQFFLGLALAAAPVGAWIAARGSVDWPPLVLALGVAAWVAGFDIIYATQDLEFDRRSGLRSIPVWLGLDASLRLAIALHGVLFATLLGFGYLARLGWIYFAAMAPIALILVFEHWVARKGDVKSINRAFFQSNAAVGGLFLAGAVLGALAQ